MVPGTEETDELQNHNERAGRGFGETEAIEHLRRGQPMIMLDCLLRNVRQHGIGAAESNNSGFAEKDSFAKNRVIGSEKNSGKCKRQRPYHNPSRGNLERMKQCWFRALANFAGKIDIYRARNFATKIFGQQFVADEAENAGTTDD